LFLQIKILILNPSLILASSQLDYEISMSFFEDNQGNIIASGKVISNLK